MLCNSTPSSLSPPSNHPLTPCQEPDECPSPQPRPIPIHHLSPTREHCRRHHPFTLPAPQSCITSPFSAPHDDPPDPKAWTAVCPTRHYRLVISKHPPLWIGTYLQR